jgi:hypothetical protein
MKQHNIFFSGFDLENRKKYTKCIVETISNVFLTAFRNRLVAGGAFVLFHIVSVLFVIYSLICDKVVSYYYIYSFIWIIIIYSNYYFNGCILSRIEKHLLQDNTWAGPINILFYPIHLFYNPNKQIMNNYIKIFWVTPVSSFIILKYLFEDSIFNKMIGLIFIILLGPLLFIHSQCDLFTHFNLILNNILLYLYL